MRRWQAYTRRDAILKATGETFEEVAAARAMTGETFDELAAGRSHKAPRAKRHAKAREAARR